MHLAIWKMEGSESLVSWVLDLKAKTRERDSEACDFKQVIQVVWTQFPQVGLIPALSTSWDYSDNQIKQCMLSAS